MTLVSLTMTQLQHTNIGNMQYLNGLFSLLPGFFFANLVCSRCASNQIFSMSNFSHPLHLYKTLWVVLRGTKGRF